MAQLKNVVDPFGEVNVYPQGDRVRVVATILMEPRKEGTQTGIALDGSGSMSKLYGVDAGGVVSSIFASSRPRLSNEISPVAQKICSYLARRIDADGGTTVIYWATGPGGSQIQELGDFTADEAERHEFGPPEDFGTGTQLLPAVKYFEERFRDAPWGFYVFITDGELHDLEEVKEYSRRLSAQIAARRRNPLKFLLIGVGPDVNEKQMEELDDLETGNDIDLWDHKLAEELRQLEQIFAEVVDKNARVADDGRLLDSRGLVIKDYHGQGLPAWLEFEVPAGTEYFTLEVFGRKIHQPLADGVRVPASTAPAAATPVIPPVVAVPPAEEDDESTREWKNLPLEFRKNAQQAPDVHVEKQEDTQ